MAKTALTKEQKERYERLALEPVNWIPAHCKIIDKKSRLITLEPKYAQLKLLQLERIARKENRPLRVIVLKARQEGITTIGAALLYHMANTRPNFSGLISAHEEEQGERIFKKFHLFEESNPDKLPLARKSATDMSYESPWSSSVFVRTAGKENLARGDTLQAFHGSEVSIWPNAEKTMISVSQAIGMSANTSIILESTANGFGGYFCDQWFKAEENKTDYVPLFISWRDDPDYQMPCPKDFELTYDENELVKEFHFTNEQMNWRRWCIQNNCGGDINLFQQEYPSYPREAFLVSGRPVFPATRLLDMIRKSVEPQSVCDFHLYGVVPKVYPSPRGCCDIFEFPRDDGVYVIGADPAEGVITNEATDPDEASAVVIELHSRKVVAHISGYLDPDFFGKQLVAAGLFYNKALLGIEINNTSGGAVREVVKDLKYPNLFMRQKYEKHGVQYSEYIGWHTDRVTRNMMVSNFNMAIRDMVNPVVIPSRKILSQMQTFIWDKAGKPIGESGKHDDHVLALMIAWQMVIERSKSDGLPSIASSATSDRPKDATRLSDGTESNLDRVAYVGAMDYGLDMAEETGSTLLYS